MIPPKIVITFEVGSYTAVWPPRGVGGTEPGGLNCVQVGVPPIPFALERTQASEKKPNTSLTGICWESMIPPKIVITFEVGSYTAVWPPRGVGGTEPDGLNCVQVGVPPIPFALERTQASEKKPLLSPAKTVMRLLAVS